MEERLKRIEEKLDILLAAMSANPEFGDFVKEGQLQLHLAQFKKELAQKASEVTTNKARHILYVLQNCTERFELPLEVSFRLRGTRTGFTHLPSSKEYVVEMVQAAADQVRALEWDTDSWDYHTFVEDILHKEGFCPLTKSELNTHFGDEINVEAELEKERLRYLEENK